MASGDSLLIFTPQCNEPPYNNIAIPDRRNQHPILDMAIDEIAIFSSVLPRHYSGNGLTIYLHYAMTSAEVNDIKLETYIERIGDQQQNLDSDGFAAAQNTGDITVPGTTGLVDIITTTHANGGEMDSLAIGEGFRLKVKRIAVAGTDAADDLELRFVEIKET